MQPGPLPSRRGPGPVMRCLLGLAIAVAGAGGLGSRPCEDGDDGVAGEPRAMPTTHPRADCWNASASPSKPRFHVHQGRRMGALSCTACSPTAGKVCSARHRTPGAAGVYAGQVSKHDEPDQAPPWRPESGQPPTVWVWPAGSRPALRVLIDGQWVYAPVRARHDWPDGRCAYHVDVVLPGHMSTVHRAYWWPQEGRLQVSHGSAVEPSTGDMPMITGEMPAGSKARRS